MTSPVKIWRNQKNIAGLIGQIGKVISLTFIRVPPAGFESQLPYFVALVELENGKTIFAQMADCVQEPRFEQKVITVLRRAAPANDSDVISYGIKVKPV